MQQIIKKIAMAALLSGALTGCAGGGYVAYRAPVPPPPPPGAYVARVCPRTGLHLGERLL